MRIMSYSKLLSVNTKHLQILAGGLSLVIHLLIVVTLVAQVEPEVVKTRTVVMVSMVEITKSSLKLPTKPESEPKENLKPESQVQTEPEKVPEPEPEPEPENKIVEKNETLAFEETEENIVLPQFQADYLQNPPPVYPSLSQRLKEQGDVLLRVRVGVNGEPLEISLQQSCGYARLDQAAQKAVRQWRFEPAQSNGKPVTAWVVVPFEFSLGG